MPVGNYKEAGKAAVEVSKKYFKNVKEGVSKAKNESIPEIEKFKQEIALGNEGVRAGYEKATDKIDAGLKKAGINTDVLTDGAEKAVEKSAEVVKSITKTIKGWFK